MFFILIWKVASSNIPLANVEESYKVEWNIQVKITLAHPRGKPDASVE